MLERRKFLGSLTAAVATAMVPAGIMAATLRQLGNSGTRVSLRDRLAPLVGSSFRLSDSTGVAKRARLVAVDAGPRCPGLDQFSVVFEGTDVTEGLYTVYHRRTGRLPISLMPSGEPGSGENRQRAYFSTFV